PSAAQRGPRGSARVSAADVAQFTRQLGVLLGAKFTLSEALASLAEQEDHPRLRTVLTSLAGSVQAGRPLAQSLGDHPSVFGTIYVASVRAAEESGNLTKVLGFLSAMLDRDHETRRQVRGALMYPACVVSTLIIAVGFLVIFVVPKFAAMFAKRGVELPLLTRALVAVGESVQSYWWLYMLLAGAGLFAARAAMRRERVRASLEGLLLRVPVLGPIVRGRAVARFARVLGVCLGSGLGLVQSLQMAGASSGSRRMSSLASELAASVESGSPLHPLLTRSSYVPKLAKRLLSAGEQSAELPRMCAVVADHFDAESGHLTKQLGTIIEPVLVVAIASAVLVVALAIFLPMWDLVTLAG
ncbi:MAG: type II secretion system F family protein, partial [Leptolyngbya sp. PLA1]|nr:type II secretion system F family protein [Leptolyngbya sp. PLA1]